MSSFDHGMDYDDHVPWADPKIQADYEAALGRFLVGFNRIEAMVSDLIVRSMQQLERTNDEITEVLDNHLKRRVEDLVKLLREAERPSIPADDIDALAKKRNTLAHGHFEQNPYSGEYEIVGRDREPDPVKWLPQRLKSCASKPTGCSICSVMSRSTSGSKKKTLSRLDVRHFIVVGKLVRIHCEARSASVRCGSSRISSSVRSRPNARGTLGSHGCRRDE